ncbi:nucleotide sugar dehydrogenase [Natrinema amylolyticum]|uniref:nucleotide sugar dehydrogenase n=1 Tax=Natrinema amylolyticum TaxID=2878679 RepID=UPI001CFA6C23|nr:nucleotide sugar dehydrogenase [Natrinema amylolyticum]
MKRFDPADTDQTGSDPADTDQTGDLSEIVRVACVGLGFVGYNSALAFSRSEYPVVGVDTDDALVEAVRDGNSPFETEELEEHIDDGNCEVTTRISEAASADVYVISVPTPLSADNSPDLSAVQAAARDVSSVLEEDNLVVVQSTVYPGCTRNDVLPELERSGLDAGSDFGVSHVPERYSPGNDESKRTARVVGSIDDAWRDLTAELYEDIADTTAPVSSLEVAETTKLVENIQRDVNIALVNEFASATERLGIDISEVIDGADTKWNFHRYEPGLGVGGHCLPIDPHYFRSAAEERGADLALIPAAREINDSMPKWYADKILQTIDGVGKSRSSTVVSVLGVTYKPNVKDIRNSPAVELIELLRNENVSVEAFDSQYPPGEEIEETGIGNNSSVIAAVRNADVVVVATGHDLFHRFDPSALAAAMAPDPILIDPQKTLDPDAVAESGLIRPRDIDPNWSQHPQVTEPTSGVQADGRGENRRETDD